jgi:hypothetical protein
METSKVQQIMDALDEAVDDAGFGLSTEAQQKIRRIIEDELAQALLSNIDLGI